MKASTFYRIAAALLLLFALGHTLGFRESDLSGEPMHFLAQCAPFTLMYSVSTEHIGTCFWPRDSLSAFFIFSQQYWRGS